MEEIKTQLELEKKIHQIKETPKYDSVCQAYDELMETEPDSVMTYGYDWMDNKLVGIFPGELILIGGESGTGKSAFANKIIESNAKKIKCGVFSLEDTPISLNKKELYFTVGKIRIERGLNPYSWRDFVTGRLKYQARFVDELGEATERLKMRNIFYQEVKGVPSHQTLTGRIELMASQDYKLILIDHLHYVDLSSSESRANKVEEVMIALTSTIKRLGVAVLLVAHFKKLDGKKPTLDSFKDSMSIAQNASTAINLWRNREEGVSEEDRKKTLFLVPKSRQLGAEGVLVGSYDINTGTYSEWVDNSTAKLFK